MPGIIALPESSPWSSDHGPIEASFCGPPPRSAPRALHGHPIMAPLKPERDRARRDIYVFTSPWSSDHGPIEAPAPSITGPHGSPSPWSSDHGPIEAIAFMIRARRNCGTLHGHPIMAPLKPFPSHLSPPGRGSLHGHPIMAPLKPCRSAEGEGRVRALHGHPIMAPLKRSGPAPDHHFGGPLHGHPIMAPLKRVPVGPGHPVEDIVSPWSSDHGPIEARACTETATTPTMLSMVIRSWPH